MAEFQHADLERVRKPAPEAPIKRHADRHEPHPLARLQSHLGNRAIARMVQRAGAEEELQAKHDIALQRESEGGEMEEEELQAKHDTGAVVGLEGGPVGEDIEQRVNSARGGGSAPPAAIQAKMEAATGADLSGVRIHQDNDSDALNRQMTAKAFTTGNDIFLRSDASTGDSHLMAHEMAHVVQQSSGRTASGGGMSVGAANDPLEHDADDLANRVLSGAAQREAEEAQA